MKLKRYITTAAAVLAVAGLLGACHTNSENAGSQTNAGQDLAEVTLGMTYIPNVQFAPFYVAQEKNLFTSKGGLLQVKLRHHGADEGLFNALLTGKENAVVAFGDEAVQASSQGMGLSVIGILYQKYPAVMIAMRDSGITSWADLKGKTVGLPGKYGSNWFALQAGLAQAGLGLEDIKVAEIGYTQQTQLSTGKVDAVIGFSNNDLVRFKLAGLDVVSAPLDDDTPLVGAALVTTQEYAAAHPQECNALVNGMVRAVSQISSDLNIAVAATKKYDETLENPTALQAARAVAEATNQLIALPVEQLPQQDPGQVAAPDAQKFRRMISLLHKIGALGSTTDLLNLDQAGLDALARPWPKA